MGADVFHRCLRIIDTVNVAYTTQTYEVLFIISSYLQTESLPDKMFLTSSLDVISSVVGSLREAAQSLIENSNLLSVMTCCINDIDDSVRQSAFGLLGDITQYCFNVIANNYKQFIVLCVQHINIEYTFI